MEPVGRSRERQSRSELVASFRAMWIAPVVALSRGDLPDAFETSRVAGGRAHTWASGWPRPLLPGGSAGRSLAAPQAYRRPDPLSAEAFPEDLGIFRDLRRPGGSLAAARQLSGASCGQGRPPHLADQHGLGAAGQFVRLRFRLHFGRTTRRAHGECTPAPWNRWSGTGATSITGTTRKRLSHCCPSISRQWTVATSRAIC